jgi:hypothetical protein
MRGQQKAKNKKTKTIFLEMSFLAKNIFLGRKRK